MEVTVDEALINRPERSEAVFSHDDFCEWSRGAVFVIHSFAIEHDDAVCVLLNASGVAQICVGWSFVWSLLNIARKLAERDNGSLQVFSCRLQTS